MFALLSVMAAAEPPVIPATEFTQTPAVPAEVEQEMLDALLAALSSKNRGYYEDYASGSSTSSSRKRVYDGVQADLATEKSTW